MKHSHEYIHTWRVKQPTAQSENTGTACRGCLPADAAAAEAVSDTAAAGERRWRRMANTT